jgi:hypothetical protein
VIASTNPIRVDADGDGAFSSARDYAAKLVREHLHQPARLCTALAAFDQPVATHAAELCADAGAALDSQEWRTALGQAAPHVRREFKSWQRWR